MKIFSHAINQIHFSDDSLPTEVIESLISTLKRLLCRFSFHGDPISSSECLLSLHKLYSFLAQPQTVLGAVSDFLLVSAKFQDLAPILLSNTILHELHEAKIMSRDGVKSILDSEVMLDSQLDLVSQCFVDLTSMSSQSIIERRTENNSIRLFEKSLQQISELVEKDARNRERSWRRSAPG